MTPITAAYLAHTSALKRWIARFTHGLDVDDILQEAFLRAYRVELQRPIEQPKSFLFRIAKHAALTHRDRARRIEYYGDALYEREDSGSPEGEAIALETLAGHLQAIRDLPAACRQVYWLRVYGDLSHKDISSRLGIAVSTVEKHCMKANQQMRSVA